MSSINDLKNAGIDLKRAFELSPNDVMVVWHLALYYAKNEEYITALNLFKRAEKISRDPLSLGAMYHYMGFELYLDIGDMDKAWYFINKSSEMNPLWENASYWFFISTGKFQEALEIANKRKQNPGFVYSYMRGKSDSVIKYYSQLEAAKKERQGKNYNANAANYRLGVALVEVGRKDEGMAILDYHLQRIEQRINAGTVKGGDLINYAGIYSFLGEIDKAIKYFKISDVNYLWGGIYYIQVAPLFDNIRDHVEYQEIVNNQLAKNKNIREEIARLEAAGEL